MKPKNAKVSGLQKKTCISNKELEWKLYTSISATE